MQLSACLSLDRPVLCTSFSFSAGSWSSSSVCFSIRELQCFIVQSSWIMMPRGGLVCASVRNVQFLNGWWLSSRFRYRKRIFRWIFLFFGTSPIYWWKWDHLNRLCCLAHLQINVNNLFSPSLFLEYSSRTISLPLIFTGGWHFSDHGASLGSTIALATDRWVPHVNCCSRKCRVSVPTGKGINFIALDKSTPSLVKLEHSE